MKQKEGNLKLRVLQPNKRVNMTKIVLDTVSSGYNLGKINANFEKIEDQLNDKVLYRDNTSTPTEPNELEQDLDLNSNRILNLPVPTSPTEPLRYGDITSDETGATVQYVDDSITTAVDIATDTTVPLNIINDPSQAYAFDGVVEMMATTTVFLVDKKLTTGNTTWRVTTNNRGWALGVTGLYALPLNGVSLEDLGGDPNNGNDSSDAWELAISQYLILTKQRFTVVLNAGDYNISRRIRLSTQCEKFKIVGEGATLTATADMDSMLSWPHIAGVEVSDIQYKINGGVTIATAIIDGGRQDGSGAKTLRAKLTNQQAFNVPTAPVFIRLTQAWEFKIVNARSDHDTTSQIGTNIKLLSCVNGQIDKMEVGYSSIGVHFTNSPDVSYKCEGIDLIAPVTTFAEVALKGDNIVALKVLGGVLDFCLIRAFEFSNGFDVVFHGTWFANRADSGSTGTMGLSLPGFNSVKLLGTHFVNNHPTNSWDAVSLNSAGCKLYGNTKEGSFTAGLVLSDADYRGNDFLLEDRTQATVSTQIAAAGAGNIAIHSVQSGETQNSADRLLNRLEFRAPQISSTARWEMDTYRGAFSDQVYVKLAQKGADSFKINFPSGNIECLRDGKGILLTSPDGLVTKQIQLSNAGTLVVI